MEYIKNFNNYYEETEIGIILEILNPIRKKEISKILLFIKNLDEIKFKVVNIEMLNIRLKWFYDAMENNFNGLKSGYNGVDEIADILQKFEIEKTFILDVIQSYMMFQNEYLFNNRDDFFEYAKNKYYNLLYIFFKMEAFNKKNFEINLENLIFLANKMAVVNLIKTFVYNFNIKGLNNFIYKNDLMFLEKSDENNLAKKNLLEIIKKLNVYKLNLKLSNLKSNKGFIKFLLSINCYCDFIINSVCKNNNYLFEGKNKLKWYQILKLLLMVFYYKIYS
jgi:hypothetical protein